MTDIKSCTYLIYKLSEDGDKDTHMNLSSTSRPYSYQSLLKAGEVREHRSKEGKRRRRRRKRRRRITISAEIMFLLERKNSNKTNV